MFGDIISDEGAFLIGSLGMASSGNIHPGKVSMYEPIHGSAPDIAGKGIANPIGTVLSVKLMMQESFNQTGIGNEIEVDIGGKYKYEGSCPLKFKGTVRLLYDGKYTLKGIPFEGINAFLGKTAVISTNDTDIVLTSKRLYPQGRAIFDVLKMDVSGKKVITLKSFNSFDFPVKDVINVYTPGWYNSHYSTVLYKKIKRPIYPLDDFSFDFA